MKSIAKADVIGQLERILSSPQIRHATVLAEFLKYVVLETLAARGSELKEYKIGVEALHKNADFDPQVDSIVRIHAGRLRRALKEYYHEEGSRDNVEISIPKGTYAPVFTFRISQPATQSDPSDNSGSRYKADPLPHHPATLRATKPTVFVYPFNLVQDGAAGIYQPLGEYLSAELTKFEELIVISNHLHNLSNDNPDLTTLVTKLSIDYMLTGSVQRAGDNARIFVYLINHDGKQIWAQTFEKSSPDENLWTLEERVVTKTLASITGFSGIIALTESLALPKVAELDTHRVLSFWYKQHTYSFDPQITAQARKYYEEVIRREPTNALAHAYLSETIIAQTFFTKPHLRETLVQQSLGFAEYAMTLDPACQQAYQALAVATIQTGKYDESVRILDKGLSLNPKSIDYVGSMGALLIFMGHFDRGFAFIEQVLPLNPAPPWGHVISLSLYAFYKGKYEEALKWLDGIKANTIWVYILRMATYAHLDRKNDAHRVLDEFSKTYPAIDLNDGDTLDHLFLHSDLTQGIRNGIFKLADIQFSEN